MDTVILLTLVELNSKTRVKSITVSIYSIYIYIEMNLKWSAFQQRWLRARIQMESSTGCDMRHKKEEPPNS